MQFVVEKQNIPTHVASVAASSWASVQVGVVVQTHPPRHLSLTQVPGIGIVVIVADRHRAFVYTQRAREVSWHSFSRKNS
ncbi:uncharacterized protein LOC121878397 isoform X3 [Homarus americanus]|uniref:uncharacterized protein LOC121878397 isoform X3 n=1 Tax=Homarus americanus TaxID=6706 RepID=UPI001C46A115|nr:uncharacterized protein LOC121878397 isoform X3 [Homarus americanus]